MKVLRVAGRRLGSYLMRDGAIVSPLLALLLCIAFTAISFYVTYQISEEDTEARFRRAGMNVANGFEEKLRLYANTGVAARHLFQIYPDLTEKEFSEFIRGMDWGSQLEGVQSFGFAEKITSKDKTAPSRVGAWPQTSNPVKLPIKYMERLAISGPSILGFDLYSHPMRRLAIDRAIELGEPVASGRLQPVMITPGSSETSFSIYTPVFHSGKPLKTKAQKEAALKGIIFVGLRSSNFFDRMARDFKAQYPSLGIEFFSGEEANNEHLLYSVPLSKEREVAYEQFVPVSVLKNSWILRITAHRGYGDATTRNMPFVILVVGLLLSASVFQILLMVRKRNRQLAEEKQILELTSKVGVNLKAEHDLENIVQMVTKTTARLMKVKFGAFQYASGVENRQGLPFYAVSGGWQSSYTKVGQLLLREQLNNPNVVRISDLHRHPELAAQDLDIRSYLSAPVISKTGKIWGGLFFADPEPGMFSRRSELIAQVIAIQAAVAMDNAHLYRSLRLAQEDATAATEAKSVFLAHMSHEIRTPLGVMLGFAELAKSSLGNPNEAEKYLDLILRNGDELTRIIGEILDLSKIEAHSLQIEDADFSFNSLLDDIHSLLNLKAQEKGLSLLIEKEGELPEFVRSDRTRIRQIFINLIGNALRFTTKGSVTLKVKSSKSQDSEERIIEFFVTDTGIGISKEQQDNLFKSFSQADSTISRRFGGTGLGLVIARELSFALGGDLYLHSSVPGKGTCFAGKIRVKDALAKIPVNEGAQFTKETLLGIKVLVVDDAADNQFLFKTYLKKCGAIVESAGDGKQGVDKAMTQGFDVVLMDLQMPVMDGHEAVAELRKRNYQGPIIALTAHAIKEEREKAMNLGFTDYLTKPIQKVQLIRAVEKYGKKST